MKETLRVIKEKIKPEPKGLPYAGSLEQVRTLFYDDLPDMRPYIHPPWEKTIYEKKD